MARAELAAVAALALALAASGCGAGQNGDETAVRNVVNRWVGAVAGHDGTAACAPLSTTLRKRIARHLLGEGVKGDCNVWAARWVSPRHPASHRAARITTVRIHGSRATVTLTAPGVPDGSATLVKEDGRWRIDDF